MSNFQLSQSINRNKVFLLNKNQLEEVWNVEFYKPEFLKNREKLKRNKYGLVKLQSITSKITKGETPLWRGDGYLKQGIIFVKSENVLENELNINDTDFIAEEVHSRMRRSQLKKGDVLLNIVGASIGRACVYDKDDDANINQAICLIRLNDGFDPYWLSSLLNSTPYKTWINQLKSGGARDNIDLGQANSFLIPNHPKEVQEKIISISRKAADQKKQNEAEAEKLLASIDNYLLKELGITLPAPPENTLNNKIFISLLGQLSGNRLDPFYYKVSFNELIDKIYKGKFKVDKIGSISNNIDTGKTPPKSAYLESDMQDILPIIKAGSYSGDFIDIEKSDFVKSDFSGNTISQGDIFILGAAHQAEYVGKKVYYLNEAPKQKTFFVGELVRISANPDKCESSFLFSLLKTKLYMALLNREKRGQTAHLYPNDVKHIFIPVPPLAKQKEIADHITGIRQQARQLKDKTKEALSKASQEIEKILLA